MPIFKRVSFKMSEEKIIEHSHKAVKTLKDKTKTISEKIKEFLEEISIIVLAVSITLLFHNWNEARHEKQLEREFLKGIKDDLAQSANDIEASIKVFQPTIDYYSNVSHQLSINKIDKKYVDTLGWYLMNTNYFVFDDSRFEGFKSSGYLRLIENEVLLKHLVVLYSAYMPFEKEADVNVFHTREQDYNKYIGINLNSDPFGESHVSNLLNDKAVRYQFFRYSNVFKERKQHKLSMIKRIRLLVN